MSTLPCGTPRDALTEIAVDGASADPALVEHAHGCPYCTAEIADINQRWDAVREAAGERPRAPEGLVDRMLDAVRSVRGGGEPFRVEQDGGGLGVAESVVVLVTRQAVRDLLAEHPGTARLRAVRVDGRTVEIRLVLSYGVSVDGVADAVRAHVRAALADHLGPAVPPVDIVVVDVTYHPRR